MSSIQLDGTHTPAKRGGEAVAYQGRKKCKTSNMLIISDSKGIPLACSSPIAGNHNDAFHLVENVQQMLVQIQKSNISTEGLFLNADAGFDNQVFKSCCCQNGVIGSIDFNKRKGTKKRHFAW